MRGIFRTASELTLAAALVCCHARCDAEKPTVSALAELGRQIASLPAGGDPATIKLPHDVTLTVEVGGFTLGFAAAVDARELAHAFHWSRPYAVSSDVHQRDWQLVVYARDVQDANNQRIATVPPRLGTWSARVELDGRPRGELPALVAGASPAYDLDHHRANVKRIRLTTSL